MMYDDARETADTSLEKLATELAARGFQTRLTAPEGRLYRSGGMGLGGAPGAVGEVDTDVHG